MIHKAVSTASAANNSSPQTLSSVDVGHSPTEWGELAEPESTRHMAGSEVSVNLNLDAAL
ncbi:hypothetical protein thsrh120_60750 [Rhizobium sp. No.120]